MTLTDHTFDQPYVSPAVEVEQHTQWLENEVETLEELANEGARFSPRVRDALVRLSGALRDLAEDVR